MYNTSWSCGNNAQITFKSFASSVCKYKMICFLRILFSNITVYSETVVLTFEVPETSVEVAKSCLHNGVTTPNYLSILKT